MPGSDLAVASLRDRLQVRATVVAYDGECEAAKLCASAFNDLLSEALGRSLPTLLAEPLPPQPAPHLLERGRHWLDADQLHTEMGGIGFQADSRADDLQLPQLLLFLPAHTLLEQEKLSGHLDWLKEVAGGFSPIISVFLDDSAQFGDHHYSQDDLTKIVRQFDKLAPSRVALNLVGTAATLTDLVAVQADLAELIAVLAADCCLTSDGDVTRPLCPDANTDRRTLATFGGSALRYSSTRVEKAVWRCLSNDILNRTLLDKTAAPLERQARLQNSPEALKEVLAEINSAGVKSHGPAAERKSVGCECVLSGPRPNGDLYYLGLEGGLNDDQLDLTEVPPSRWLEVLYTWEFLRNRSTADLWCERIAKPAKRIGTKLENDISDVVTKQLFQPGGLAQAEHLLDALGKEIEAFGAIRLDAGKIPLPRESLQRVSEALAAIPHLATLAGRTALLLCLQAIVLVYLWPHVPAWAGVLVLMSTIGLGLVTLAVPAYVYLKARSEADAAARAAVADAGARCGVIIAQELQSALHGISEHARGHLKRLRTSVGELHELATAATSASAGSPNAASEVLVEHLPHTNQYESFYSTEFAKFLAPDHPSGLMRTFQEELAPVGRQVLTGLKTAAEFLAQAEAFCRRTVRFKASQIELWHFFRQDTADNAPAFDDAKVGKALQALSDRKKRVFLNSRAVRESVLIAGGTSDSFLLCRPICTVDTGNAVKATLTLPNAMVHVTRVTLAQSPSADRAQA